MVARGGLGESRSATNAVAPGTGSRTVSISMRRARVTAAANLVVAVAVTVTEPLAAQLGPVHRDAGADASAPRCAVVIDAVTREEHLRGTPRSAARDAAERAGGDRRAGVERFSYYARCTYAVRVNRQPYRFTFSPGAGPHEPPDRSCDTPASRAGAVAALRRSTRGCADLRAGAYYGYELTRPDGSPP
jgi:hypothetical protein